MNEEDYRKVIRHLEAAGQVLHAQQGQLSETDIRIRHLLSITTAEAKRGLRAAEQITLSQMPPLNERGAGVGGV
jgi:hypothetical protein